MKTILPHREAPVLSGGRQLRHELKYLINEGTYHVLRNRLLPLMSADEHSHTGGYRVTSLYFDDIYRSGYNDKVNGLAVRRKFRVRSYGLDKDFIRLEAKHKDDSYVSKLSAELSAEQYKALLAGDHSFMAAHDSEEDVFGEFYRCDRLTALRPVVIVDYMREALVYPFGNVRITFDKQLSACYNSIDMFAQESQFSQIYDKDIILEVKYDNYIPLTIQSVLQGLNASQQSVSKYVICTDRLMEVKNTDLPY